MSNYIRMSISVPNDLIDLLEHHPGINKSEICAAALAKHVLNPAKCSCSLCTDKRAKLAGTTVAKVKAIAENIRKRYGPPEEDD